MVHLLKILKIIWEFLKDPNNRSTLAWLGVAIVAGLTLIGIIPPNKTPKDCLLNNSKTENCTQKVDGWNIITQRFCDTKNKCAVFASVVSQDLYWKISSVSDFVSISKGDKGNFIDHITSKGISYQLKRFQILVAVGAASYEKSKDDISENTEYKRAHDRALAIQTLLKQNIVTNACIYIMTLGSNPNIVEDSSKQRLVVIIGIYEPESGFDVVDALNNDINKQIKAFPFNRNDYKNVHIDPMNC